MLRAAESILERDGIGGLTLRAAAREAGVSHAAPKNHFGDAMGLLSDLAAQRGALPRRPRRGQERNLARGVTGGRRALRPRVPRRESQKECAGNQRQRCRCSSNELACRKHWRSLAPVAPGDTIG